MGDYYLFSNIPKWLLKFPTLSNTKVSLRPTVAGSPPSLLVRKTLATAKRRSSSFQDPVIAPSSSGTLTTRRTTRRTASGEDPERCTLVTPISSPRLLLPATPASSSHHLGMVQSVSGTSRPARLPSSSLATRRMSWLLPSLTTTDRS